MIPEITIHKNSGFCFGVRNAVSLAEKSLEEQKATYCLGKIVHNPVELKRLSDKGLIIISHEQFTQLHDETVLIRAHGEPPETFETARQNKLKLIDATCPIVSRLQDKIRKAADEMEKSGGKVFIFGKKDHPEVMALVGQSGKRAFVVSGIADTGAIDFSKPLTLFAQTTMDPEKYGKFIEEIRQRIVAAGADPDKHLIFSDSICRHVSNRMPEIREFAGKYDMILFVSGKESSNGRMLFESCRNANQNSWFISQLSDMDDIDYKGIDSIGICGATSTPVWLMEEVAEAVKQKTNLSGQLE